MGFPIRVAAALMASLAALPVIVSKYLCYNGASFRSEANDMNELVSVVAPTDSLSVCASVCECMRVYARVCVRKNLTDSQVSVESQRVEKLIKISA